MRLLLGFAQRRQQERSKDGDDRDDNEQFDQRETGRQMVRTRNLHSSIFLAPYGCTYDLLNSLEITNLQPHHNEKSNSDDRK